MLSVDRAGELLEAFGGLRLAVVGDLMLDRYIHGAAERISPEAPVPVVRVLREFCVPGGAANVAANIVALGAKVDLAGIRGNDDNGVRLVSLLGDLDVGCQGILCDENVATIVKTRIMADRQQVVRVDRDDSLELDNGQAACFIDKIVNLLPGADGVVMEDYGKGTLTQDVVDTVLAQSCRLDIPVGFDPRDNHELRLDGITLATPNWNEAMHAAGWIDAPSGGAATTELLERVADCLMSRWSPRLLVMTLGSQGMYLAPRDGQRRLIPTRAREVFDVSGAGDTVIAACMLSLAAGATEVEAVEIANHAAGIVVGKLGTAVCRPAELLDSVSRREASAV